MIRRLRPVAVAAAVMALTACGGGGGGTELATAGPAEFSGPEGDEVAITHVSDPMDGRRTIFGIVENGTGEAKPDVVMAGQAFDGAGTKVAQGRGQVVTPLTLPKDGIALVQVTFDNPLPEPFTVEWEVRKGDREKDAVDLKVTSLDVDTAGNVIANVENSTGGRVRVVHLVVLCLGQDEKAISISTFPGPDNRVAKGASVRIEGSVGAGCVSAVAGAIGTKNVT